MSFANPTRLRIGMHGEFAGKDFRLLGRSVLGVDIDGETYYWNEFNLEAKTGESATLVYEETERGGEWRLFTEFEPDYPLTAEDAAAKQVGDQINLTGTNVRITLVDSSRVYYTEGEAPEGEAVGSTANYFNAESGNVMQVVSWTGQEVEYYNGLTLQAAAVNTAFNLSPQAPARMFSGSANDSVNLSTEKFMFWVVTIAFVFFIAFGRNFSREYEAAPVKRVSAPPTPPLTVGASGNWGGKHYRIVRHAVVEIAEPGTVYERHEYELADDYDLPALIICGEKPGVKKWTFFLPLHPLVPPTAQQSAAKKNGDTVNVDGVTGTINDLFQRTVKQVDGDVPDGSHQGDVQYGYVAGTTDGPLLVRWNAQNINFLQGHEIAAADFTGAFPK